jgi:Cys-rich repeat protein
MKSRIVIGFFGLAAFSALSVACGGSGSASSDLGTSSANRLTLDVRCAADSDCPTGFQCEIEVEHGVSQSYCESHDPVPAGAPATCPAGFESEPEHGALACKPDGSGAAGGGSSGSSGGSASGGHGADDVTGGSDGGHGADDDAAASTGTSPAGAACTTSADCATGLECEIDIEHGGTTTVCHLHGGGSSGGGKK